MTVWIQFGNLRISAKARNRARPPITHRPTSLIGQLAGTKITTAIPAKTDGEASMRMIPRLGPPRLPMVLTASNCSVFRLLEGKRVLDSSLA